MKILFLSRWLPALIDNGSKLRVYNLLYSLARYHNVKLLSFVEPSNVSCDLSELRSLCSEVETVPWREYDPHSRRARLGYLGLLPRFLSDTYSTQMEALIRSSVSKDKYDLVIASQLSMASYYPCFHGLPAIFEEIELGLFHDSVIFAESIHKRMRSSFTWLKLRKYLSRLLNSFERCTVASQQECSLFITNFPKHKEKVNVIPNSIIINDYQGLNIEPKVNHLIFTGSFRYYANYEALQWFVGEVFSEILLKMPKTHLIITGDHANLPIPSLPNITLAGYVNDIKSMIASSWISIAPLLTGGGTRLKILEAMALGTPVVSTSKGAEGLDVTHGVNILIADTPEAFSQAVLDLLSSSSLRARLSAGGRVLVAEKYNTEKVGANFNALVERVIHTSPASR